MSDHIYISGYINMSRELYDDLMKNGVVFNGKECFFDNDSTRYYCRPSRHSLKEIFYEIEYKNGCMVVNTDQGEDVGYAIVEAISEKLGENDTGYLQFTCNFEEHWCYWLRRNEVVEGRWKKPKDPDWFPEESPTYWDYY